ncbi:MAG: class I SAM-dependent methyltransferase [Cyclobacteriaceae bacterium]|nr:class I SAM-dependent methyltransferase [Cyclobacteriaceae bacterium SS2]
MVEQGWTLLEKKQKFSDINRKVKPQKYVPALGFDWLTIWYDLTIRLTMPERKFRNKLIDHLDPCDEERILEFGFGTGANLVLVADRAPDARFTGLDIDPKVRKMANRKLTRYGIKIPLKLYDGEIFPFPSDSFDKVYSCLVFHHLNIENKRRTMMEIFRVLEPGGRLIIGDWGKAKSPILRTAFYAIQLLDGFKNTRDNVDGRLPELMQETGFTGVKETDFINTMIGSFCYYEGLKSRLT